MSLQRRGFMTSSCLGFRTFCESRRGPNWYLIWVPPVPDQVRTDTDTIRCHKPKKLSPKPEYQQNRART